MEYFILLPITWTGPVVAPLLLSIIVILLAVIINHLILKVILR